LYYGADNQAFALAEIDQMKAHIKTPDGVEVQIDGTASEVAEVLNDVKIKAQVPPKAKNHAAKAKNAKGGLPGLIDALKEDSFFKKPQTLNAIRLKLKDLGHNYPVTTLSATMGREVRKRNLRRFKENKKYVYAQ
jgi:superfamily II DNA/RNA helicase